MLNAFPRIGDNWKLHGFGLGLALLCLSTIYTGGLWNIVRMSGRDVPEITCADRPFAYVSYQLLLIGLTYGFLVGKPS